MAPPVFAALVMLVNIGETSVSNADSAVNSGRYRRDGEIQQILSCPQQRGQTRKRSGREGCALRPCLFHRVQGNAARIALIPGLVSGRGHFNVNTEADAVRALLPVDRIDHLIGTVLMELGAIGIVSRSIGIGGGSHHADDRG